MSVGLIKNLFMAPIILGQMVWVFTEKTIRHSLRNFSNLIDKPINYKQVEGRVKRAVRMMSRDYTIYDIHAMECMKKNVTGKGVKSTRKWK